MRWLQVCLWRQSEGFSSGDIVVSLDSPYTVRIRMLTDWWTDSTKVSRGFKSVM